MQNYKQIAQETLEIIEANNYVVKDKLVRLSNKPQYLREVIVYDFDSVVASVRTLKENIRISIGEIKVDTFDSLTSAKVNGVGRVLVLNFANAYHPGGGFLRGAIAQEEAICRCSSLYVSISSEKAAEMYAYNKAHISPEGSDYMLLSPNVCVFRDCNCNLISNPYNVSVITAAAPNLYDEAYKLNEPQLGEIMRHKIRNVITVAAQNAYDTLILGAWGCGAFGHNARDMAGYFYDVLVGENYRRYFDRIVFSIYAKDEYDYNYKEFAKSFKV